MNTAVVNNATHQDHRPLLSTLATLATMSGFLGDLSPEQAAALDEVRRVAGPPLSPVSVGGPPF